MDDHGSEFDLRTGAVEQGPATRPAVVFEVRVLNGWFRFAVLNSEL